MGAGTVRIGVAFWLAGCFCRVLCQTSLSDAPPQQIPPDPVLYENFFRQVVQSRKVSGPVLLNGQASTLPQPTFQEAAGLTDQEAQVLSALAADCEAKTGPLHGAVGSLVFESRLQSAESGEVSGWLTQRLKDLDDRRDQIVLDHVRQLKAAFGDSRFQTLDAYVRSRQKADASSQTAPKKK